MSRLMTFHKIVEGAEAGDREAWLAFLTAYAPVMLALAEVYLPGPGATTALEKLLAALTVDGYKQLRSLDHQAEREFLVDLRYTLLDAGSSNSGNSGPAQDVSGVPRPTLPTVSALIHGLPLAHQAIVFLKLAGYSDRTLEKIFTITPTLVQKGLERLPTDYRTVLETPDRCPWPTAWHEMIRELRAIRSESCTPARQLVRVIDGQIAWDDKEPVERHLTTCLTCLERWTALREVIHYRRETRPLSRIDAERWLGTVSVRHGGKSEKSFFQRIFG